MKLRAFSPMEESFIDSWVREPAIPRAENFHATDIFSSITSAVGRAFDATRETVAEAADIVGDKVGDLYDATVETIADAADVVTEAAEKVGDAVSDAYNSTVETASSAADVVADAYTSAVESVVEAADKVGDVLGDAYDFTRETIASGYDSSRDYVAEFGTSMATYWNAKKELEERKEKNAEARGEMRQKAKSEVREKRFTEALAKAKVCIDSHEAYFKMLIAMQAVAQASAACAGVASNEDKQQIDEFLMGMGGGFLPAKVQTAINLLSLNPPTLKEAFIRARKVGPEAQPLFEEIIDFVTTLNGEMSVTQKAFRSGWAQLSAAA
ncbi:hypothetical protein [Pseudomonas sp. B21-021]|uniref:hypothetical protein n=1 Tax=Pseudomonas sp. B21-021 TaxID=2895476 RepID=UPI002160BF64|nr:hypothetical protein [Pseudomonas sp. B21-021]UVM25552.1 hypothetical protein LOY31_19155 [Pseudomonas sp. B21-021]